MNIPRDKKFFEHGEWAEILAIKDLRDQPKDVFRRFCREAVEDGYRREYYDALEFMGQQGPDWEDLTKEQRENIREQQRENALDMQNLGQAIASGDPEKIDRAGKELLKR